MVKYLFVFFFFLRVHAFNTFQAIDPFSAVLHGELVYIFFQRKIATAHFKKRGNDSSPNSLKRKWRYYIRGKLQP